MRTARLLPHFETCIARSMIYIIYVYHTAILIKGPMPIEAVAQCDMPIARHLCFYALPASEVAPLKPHATESPVTSDRLLTWIRRGARLIRSLRDRSDFDQ